MAFFSSVPNLPNGEKARIEFHLQQIAECIGFERFRSPVIGMSSLMKGGTSRTVDQVVAMVSDHLSHDVKNLKIVVKPQPIEKCGGGG